MRICRILKFHGISIHFSSLKIRRRSSGGAIIRSFQTIAAKVAVLLSQSSSSLNPSDARAHTHTQKRSPRSLRTHQFHHKTFVCTLFVNLICNFHHRQVAEFPSCNTAIVAPSNLHLGNQKQTETNKKTTRNSVKIVTLVHKKLELRDEDDLGVAEEECIPLMQVLPAC